VTHVDGSGRLQTVKRASNPRYHRLIESFRELTGIPMVLNTSFNENEPVVCKPEEALDWFLRTTMDRSVMGNVTGRGSVAIDFTPGTNCLIQSEKHAIICIGIGLILIKRSCLLPMRAEYFRL
jgi:predicted NodU family carbamoyl transferase